MKKILILIVTLGITLTSCEKFLDENPDLNGKNIITKVTQLDQMVNEMNYYIKGSWSIGSTVGFATAIASDDVEFHPDVQAKSGAADVGLISILDPTYLELTFGSSYEFSKLYEMIYHINTIIVNIPNVSGDENVKIRVEAEAKAYRAMLHFLLHLNYVQHPALGDNPGVGYRDDISFDSPTIASRNTSKYTMDRIYQDINEAILAFEQVGEIDFDLNRSWRFNKVNLSALKARIDLYNGNYKDAYDAASFVLNNYDFVYDLNDGVNSTDRFFTDGSVVTKTLADGVSYDLPVSWCYFTKDNVASMNNEEMLIPFFYNNPYAFLPMSKSLYDTYNLKNDLRYVKFFKNNQYMNMIGHAGFTSAELAALDEYKWQSYQGVTSSTTSSSMIGGPTVPEMMLIKAECLVRGKDGVTADAAQALTILQSLRAKRFDNATDADNITSSLDDVLAERRRELPLTIRWYDLKRLNAVENAGIVLSKNYFTDKADATSGTKVYSVQPNSAQYTLPIPFTELQLLPGWTQNPTN